METSTRTKEMISLISDHGYTLEAVADRFGLTKQRIHQIVSKHPTYVSLVGKRRSQRQKLRPLPKAVLTADGRAVPQGTIYIVQAVDTNYFKIGFTEGKPEWRIERLRFETPFHELTLVRSFQVSYPRYVEAKLQRLLKHARFPESSKFRTGKTEWFKLISSEDLAILNLTEDEIRKSE